MTNFTLPCPYEGWSEARLKAHCRSLSKAFNRQQQIILVLADHGINALPPDWLDEVRRLQQAFSDE